MSQNTCAIIFFMKTLYFKENLCIIDFDKQYHENYQSLASSEDYKLFLEHFLIYLKQKHSSIFYRIQKITAEPIAYLVKLTKLLLVFDLNELEFIQQHRNLLLEVVEEAYNYWRKLTRFTIVHASNQHGVSTSNFMDADGKYNALIIGFYRHLEEKLQQQGNLVYRQLHAGSNGSLFLMDKELNLPENYQVLKNIPVIHKVMLRTPLILHTKYNKRQGMFTACDHNPIEEINALQNFMCFPILVGTSITYVYFHQDFLNSAIGLSNLFQLLPYDRMDEKPDCIVLFGIDDQKEETVFYYDQENDIHVGKISLSPIIEYFGYFKKMALTLHNLSMMKKAKLPIHGAMINLYFNDGSKKGVVLMGDSGAGKSETIEALERISSDSIIKKEIIFDDMGAMYVEDGVIYASGTEIGAFIRLDDLDKGSIYKDIDRSVFFNPESNKNARLILPETAYDVVVAKHQVDYFLYANNYTDQYGLKALALEEAKNVFKTGRRFALGTTGEIGISETYFANPFGPMQKQAECDILIDDIFTTLSETPVFLGEIYTGLGLNNQGNHLDQAAAALLKHMEGKHE